MQKTIKVTPKITNRATMRPLLQDHFAPPHSIARRRQIMLALKSTVPSISSWMRRCFSGLPFIASGTKVGGGAWNRKKIATAPTPPRGRLM